MHDCQNSLSHYYTRKMGKQRTRIPLPLSWICSSFVPPSLTVILILVLPASNEFSMSSLRALLGLWMIYTSRELCVFGELLDFQLLKNDTYFSGCDTVDYGCWKLGDTFWLSWRLVTRHEYKYSMDTDRRAPQCFFFSRDFPLSFLVNSSSQVIDKNRIFTFIAI